MNLLIIINVKAFINITKLRINMNFQFIKRSLFFLMFLYITLYIPMSIMIYSNSFYYLNYPTRIENNLNQTQIEMITKDMTNLFLHKTNSLNHEFGWSNNEIKHFNEVRDIYDILFILALISWFGFFYLFNKKELIKNTKINIIISLLFILIIPFFVYFWNNILHPLLFSNNLWISQPNSLMGFLFPYSFFENSLIFLIVFSTIINLSFYLLFRKK